MDTLAETTWNSLKIKDGTTPQDSPFVKAKGD